MQKIIITDRNTGKYIVRKWWDRTPVNTDTFKHINPVLIAEEDTHRPFILTEDGLTTKDGDILHQTPVYRYMEKYCNLSFDFLPMDGRKKAAKEIKWFNWKEIFQLYAWND